MTDWHGWLISRGDRRVALHVGPLPGRKSVAVYTVRAGVMQVHAYCRDEESAQALVVALDELIPVETP